MPIGRSRTSDVPAETCETRGSIAAATIASCAHKRRADALGAREPEPMIRREERLVAPDRLALVVQDDPAALDPALAERPGLRVRRRLEVAAEAVAVLEADLQASCSTARVARVELARDRRGGYRTAVVAERGQVVDEAGRRVADQRRGVRARVGENAATSAAAVEKPSRRSPSLASLPCSAPRLATGRSSSRTCNRVARVASAPASAIIASPGVTGARTARSADGALVRSASGQDRQQLAAGRGHAGTRARHAADPDDNDRRQRAACPRPRRPAAVIAHRRPPRSTRAAPDRRHRRPAEPASLTSAPCREI